VRENCPISSLYLSSSYCKKGMSSASDNVTLSSSGSGSEWSGGDGSSRSDGGSGGQTVGMGRIPMETVSEVREDPLEEIAESNWSAKAGYKYVTEDVQTQHSFFKWSRLLKSWLNCIPILERNISRDIVALERVSGVDCVCHGQEGTTEGFFYMYMCQFSQLHVRLPFDDFTMGVLRLLKVTPTHLHPNSWAYLQALRVLY